MMGSKGIGRFAAAKLGGRMALMSTSGRKGEREEVLIPELDWSVFNGETYLSDIAIDYYTQPTDGPTGTLIEVLDLHEAWPEAKINRLILELRRLLSPIALEGAEDRFEIFLDLTECTKESAGFDGKALLDLVNSTGGASDESETKANQVLPFPLLTSCDYEVIGTFDIDGNFKGTFQNRRAGSGPEQIEEEEERCGPVGVRLFLFDREADALRSNMRAAGLGDLTATEARKILDNIAGVAIYRNGFRVRPYGDPDNDWLTLDKRRVQNPSLRIGHNQIAGYITVADQEESGLVERSSREGFEENGAFRRLTRIVEVLLDREIEPKRYKFRSHTGISRKGQTTYQEVRQLAELGKIRELVQNLAPQQRAEAEQLLDTESSRLTDRIDQLEERQRILEAKSSLGAIVSEILHEGAQPASYIATTAARLKSVYPDLFGIRGPRTEEAKAQFSKKLPLVAENGQKLATLFRNLKPLAGGKRGPPSAFVMMNAIKGAIDLFHNHSVPIEIENPDRVFELIGYRDDLSTALVNLISNALHWLEDSDTKNPRISILVRAKGENAIIFVVDNGPGVKEEFADLIFDVGFSLKSGGTGLGLNIAKEALARSDASLGYHLDFGDGARFEIRFPRVIDNNGS
jgi:signal transduction histidine kinase